MRIEWSSTIFIIGYHLALLIGLPFFFMHNSPGIGIYLSAFFLLYASGLSITAGYHRLYSHKSYKTNKFVESILLFFGSMATQGSALKWAFDHRNHHAYVDSDKDPYSIKKGFMFAHLLWMFKKQKPIEKSVVSDLYKNKLVMFQHKFYVPLMFATNIIAFLLVGYICSDYLGAFVIAWWVRLLFLHHFTWFINSLAHTWGAQKFSKEHSAVDNYIISLLTFGEGYHNYHHTFANDYRNGIKWYHFDPTKWIIWTLNKLKLASDLRKINHIKIMKKIALEEKSDILENIKQCWFVQKKAVEEKVEKITDDLLKKLSETRELINQYNAFKKSKANKSLLKSLNQKIKSSQRQLKEEWKNWKRFSKGCSNIHTIFSS
ncbi:MAG: fatty acid desaturase [Chlamydiota bacterium]|jgi:stearoyl-CoA desaturase (delta-9 desaturase)